MSSQLITLGVKQGTILSFPAGVSTRPEFQTLTKEIQKGRYGLFENKTVTTNDLFVVLTQDCSISGGKYIELAQLKPKEEVDELKQEHLFLGKDYGKLYLKHENKTYVAEEIQLSKVKSSFIEEYLGKSIIQISSQLNPRTKKIILDWRILAYFREPYPHNFNLIFVNYLKTNGQWFSEYLLENQDDIASVRIYVTPDDVEEAPEYKFSITAICCSEGDALNPHRKAFERMIKEINQFDGIDCIQSEAFDITSIEYPPHLVLDTVLPLDEFSFANAEVMREFNFQYLCY